MGKKDRQNEQRGIDLPPGFDAAIPTNSTKPRGVEVWGFGLERTAEGYRACRVSSHGAVEYIGPKTNTGEHRFESKSLALSRASDAFREEYAPATNMRFAK